ncbi:exopolygalacturonase-like [Telopea speciosissima]|uniref:exopolygalacturonase-like n=1 Tax=Telopea speciosissima TaxID=54955 RepID=UPI001CC5A11C|nr:exopolygalacturonase-like [Telopea speciosissima]
MVLKLKQWAICALFLLVAGVAEARVFDMINYGAKAYGKMDISKALISAWNDSCASVEQMILEGSCKSPSVGFQLEGVVQAPSDPATFKTDGWIIFQNNKGLTVSGGGTFDGQGQKAWSNSNCAQDPNCELPPAAPLLVQLSNIKFNMIRRTTQSQITVIITCSRAVPCEHLEVGDINLQYTGKARVVQATCTDVKPILFGLQIPAIHCSLKQLCKIHIGNNWWQNAINET